MELALNTAFIVGAFALTVLPIIVLFLLLGWMVRDCDCRYQ